MSTTSIVDWLSSPDVAPLLAIHPNDVTVQDVPAQWASWWTWASDDGLAWLRLMRYYTRPRDDDAPDDAMPPELRSLADTVRSLQLERTPFTGYADDDPPGDRSYRISPKKAHEVDRMSSYISHLVRSETPRSVWHAVDVGSGQGYLSRALQELDLHVLALDGNEHQTSGANRWTSREAARRSTRRRRTNLGLEASQNSSHLERSEPQIGSLTHRTVHVCPRTLQESISDWLIDPPGGDTHHPSPRRGPVPVMLVALHACGSLTVDVLRTFLSDRARAPHVERVWRPHALVVVGCCYNLMPPSDFPLSKRLRELDPIPRLTIAAVHLAAQVPSEWLKGPDSTRSAELALRKVVYRALLQPVLQAGATQLNAIADHPTVSERPIQPGVGETVENRRLGKLNDKAYQDWPTFLERATGKLGIDLEAISPSLPGWFTHEAVRLKMESALYVLQTMRCILGPLIETLILLDRRDWVQDELAEMNECGPEVEVEMVNLFDQATGSGRNVALVIKPPQRVCPMIESV